MTTIAPTTRPDGTRSPGSQPLRGPLRDAPQATPIDPAAFRETLAFLTPKAEEMSWASIPWQTDLWEARKLAADENKPIFLWAMNGKPFGCV